MNRCAHPKELTWLDQTDDGTPVWGCEGCGHVARVPASNGHHRDVRSGGYEPVTVSVPSLPDDPF